MQARSTRTTSISRFQSIISEEPERSPHFPTANHSLLPEDELPRFLVVTKGRKQSGILWARHVSGLSSLHQLSKYERRKGRPGHSLPLGASVEASERGETSARAKVQPRQLLGAHPADSEREGVEGFLCNQPSLQQQTPAAAHPRPDALLAPTVCICSSGSKPATQRGRTSRAAGFPRSTIPRRRFHTAFVQTPEDADSAERLLHSQCDPKLQGRNWPTF